MKPRLIRQMGMLSNCVPFDACYKIITPTIKIVVWKAAFNKLMYYCEKSKDFFFCWKILFIVRKLDHKHAWQILLKLNS